MAMPPLVRNCLVGKCWRGELPANKKQCKACKILRKVLLNIVEHPGEAKFKRVSAAMLFQKLEALDGYRQLLALLGFNTVKSDMKADLLIFDDVLPVPELRAVCSFLEAGVSNFRSLSSPLPSPVTMQGEPASFPAAYPPELPWLNATATAYPTLGDDWKCSGCSFKNRPAKQKMSLWLRCSMCGDWDNARTLVVTTTLGLSAGDCQTLCKLLMELQDGVLHQRRVSGEPAALNKLDLAPRHMHMLVILARNSPSVSLACGLSNMGLCLMARTSQQTFGISCCNLALEILEKDPAVCVVSRAIVQANLGKSLLEYSQSVACLEEAVSWYTKAMATLAEEQRDISLRTRILEDFSAVLSIMIGVCSTEGLATEGLERKLREVKAATKCK